MDRLFVPEYAGDEHAVDREEIARRVHEIARQVTDEDADERMIVCYYDRPDVSPQMTTGLKSLMIAILALIKGNLSAGRRYRRLGVIVVLDDGDPGPPAAREADLHA